LEAYASSAYVRSTLFELHCKYMIFASQPTSKIEFYPSKFNLKLQKRAFGTHFSQFD
jgi:hypothetical protein